MYKPPEREPYDPLKFMLRRMSRDMGLPKELIETDNEHSSFHEAKAGERAFLLRLFGPNYFKDRDRRNNRNLGRAIFAVILAAETGPKALPGPSFYQRALPAPPY